MERYVKRILQAMFNTLVGKKMAVFGFAFKPDTGDTRDAPAIYICKRLLEEKACLKITDPYALDNARNDLQSIEGKKEFFEDPYKAVEGVHAIALITEWTSYKELDYRKIFEKTGNLPQIEKREKTAFNEFKLSNPESAFRRKTLIEYH